MDFRKNDTERAINLLKLYKSQLNKAEEKSLRKAMDKLIEALDSPLFNALLDIQEFYEHSLNYNQNMNQYYTETVVPENAPPVAEKPEVPEKPTKEKKKKKKSKRETDQTDEAYKQTDEYIESNDYAQEQYNQPQYEHEQYDDNVNSGSGNQPEENPWEFYELELSKEKKKGYGFGVAGGYDKPHYEGDNGIFVTKIIKDGSAEIDGRLRINDVVVSVNDVNLDNVTHEMAVDTLKNAGKYMKLVIRRLREDYYTNQEGDYQDADPPSQKGAAGEDYQQYTEQYQEDYEFNNFELVLTKRHGAGLGFSIQGGYDPEENSEEEAYISVSRITPGGLAEKDGRLLVDDVILMVDGNPLNGMTHDQVVNILKNTGKEVKLFVGRFLSVNEMQEQPPAVEKQEKKKKKKSKKDRHEE